MDIKPLDATPSDYPYPFPARELALNTQGNPCTWRLWISPRPTPGNCAARYFYYTAATRLLHGKNFSCAYWQDTINALTARVYPVIVSDQIDFGKSSKPLWFQYSFPALAENTRALLDNLQVESAIVAGHSMSGMLASRFALMYPERVEKLILINPIGLEATGTLSKHRSIHRSGKAQTPEKVKTT